MLARRFSLVCLLCALFGIGFADLVARHDRADRFWTGGLVVPCETSQGIACKPLALRVQMPARRF